jgi:hypothetical protein
MASRHRPTATPLSIDPESGFAPRTPVNVSSSERPGPAGEWGEGLGLPRLPEPFHRVYSPPEAPKDRTRRHGMIGAVASVFAVMALAAVVIVVYGRGGGRTKGESTFSNPAPRPKPSVTARPARPPTFASIPSACDVLPAGTVRRFVPTDTPTVEKMGVETASVCKYSFPQGRRYHALQVDARAYLPKYMHDQATALTISSYEGLWQQAVKDRTSDTSSLRRITGVGDEAFERYWIDRDVHVAIGEVTVRYRNLVLRMEYSEEQPAAREQAASERRCLANAIAAAHAGLPAFR